MLFIKNGHIKPMVGVDLPCGDLLIGDDGKILEIGVSLNAPENCPTIDAQGRLVTPGCIDAHCHIGLDNEAVGWEQKYGAGHGHRRRLRLRMHCGDHSRRKPLVWHQIRVGAV